MIIGSDMITECNHTPGSNLCVDCVNSNLFNLRGRENRELVKRIAELEADKERLQRRYDVASYMLVEGCQPDNPDGFETPWFLDLFDGKGDVEFETWEEMLDHVARESGLKVPSDTARKEQG